MTKAHLKRISMPKTWPFNRKKNTFIKRPNPGSRPLELTVPISSFLIEMTRICRNNKEVKQLLTFGTVFVDSRKRKDHKFPVGFASVVSIGKKQYRLSLNEKGKLKDVEISDKEANFKVVTVYNKTITKKGLQLNLSDGRNILTKDNKLKTGQSLLLKLPEQKIENTYSLEKGSKAFLVKGNQKGKLVDVESVEGTIIKFKVGKDHFESKKAYALALGTKPKITL